MNNPFRRASRSHAPDGFCGRTRREFLWQAGGGFTAVALAAMLGEDGFLDSQAYAADGVRKFVNPLAPKRPHFPAKAKSVIFLYMYGGPSQIDTFDYKPIMKGMDGKTVEVKTFGRGGHRNQGRIVEPRWNFKQYGQSGQWVSDLFSQSGHLCGRHRLSKIHDCRFADSWFRHATDEHGKDPERQSVHWLLG